MRSDYIQKKSPEDMTGDELTELVKDLYHRMSVHETIWFREVEHQLGLDRALGIMDEAWTRTREISEKRYVKELGIDLKSGRGLKTIEAMSDGEKLRLSELIAKNWLAQDGVWFQAVESRYGMNDAKRCNDSAWARFSPFEAWSVKRLLGLPEAPGLEGLMTALNFRLYGRLNRQSAVLSDEHTLIFEMNECRVQSARMRKGLADYPCKSAGLVEYARFAEYIDSRIRTECIGCPPDEHPREWACAWKFILE